MIYTNILAVINSKLDPSGIFCLAAIPCIIVVMFAYSKGLWGGSCSCLIFFVIAIFATGDLGDAGSGATNITPNPTFITNRSQTKMIERYKYSINDPNCVFIIFDQDVGAEDRTVFIPAEEMYVGEDGWYRMKSNRERSHRYELLTPKQMEKVDKNSRWVFGDWGNPNDYLYKNDQGIIVKLNTGKVPTDDDYYLYDATIAPANAPTEAGGYGVPQWLYHPAAPVYIFGIGGLPALLGGMFIASKLRG